MTFHRFPDSTNWKVSYAWRKGDETGESSVNVHASNISDAINNAEHMIIKIGLGKGWESFSVWDVGIMEEDVI